MKSNLIFALMLALPITAFTACGSDDTDTNANQGGMAGAPAALTDAQIAKVISTANDGEVMTAQAAKPSLQDSAAVGFAQMMIDEHSAANGQILALVSTKHLAPEVSDVSDALESDAAAALMALSAAAAEAFDKTYVDGQVALHQQVLSLIDGRLLPEAHDGDLKALLVSLRSSVATHLSMAQTISATFP